MLVSKYFWRNRVQTFLIFICIHIIVYRCIYYLFSVSAFDGRYSDSINYYFDCVFNTEIRNDKIRIMNVVLFGNFRHTIPYGFAHFSQVDSMNRCSIFKFHMMKQIQFGSSASIFSQINRHTNITIFFLHVQFTRNKTN